MRRKTLRNIILVLAAVLAAELVFLGVMAMTQEEPMAQADSTEETTAATTEGETEPPTESQETSAPMETEETTEVTTGPISYTLTFVGDCTLGSEPSKFASQYSFVGTVGEDYDYPFANVVEYFENDDMTFANLECVFADSGTAADKLFVFRGPTAYTQILTGSSVEVVSLANNHTMDFGTAGYTSTKECLEEAGVAYVEQDKTQLVTTESGLVIGIYADAFTFSVADIQSNIASLKAAGAEVIICAFHWGTEGSYRATSAQQTYAHAAIDAGADIVWGHHPHVLQTIEEYNGGVIYYSLGNFSFGGNNYPQDLDSAIIQQEIIRDTDGSISLGEMTIIPVSCSSMAVQNNFQPTPYEEGSTEYERVLSKLDGSFTGADLYVSYNDTTSTEATEAATGATDATTGETEATTGATEATTGATEAATGATEAATAATTATTADTPTSGGETE